MSIRISGGSLKGRLIGSPHPAKGVRPTTERVKLAIFSILGDYRVQDTNVLDLYSCTGALGFEAISRGALSVDMVEKNFKNYKLIVDNVKKLEIQDGVQVHKSTVSDYLNLTKKRYGLILVDPPFDLNEWEKVLMNIGEKDILIKEGVLVAEHPARVFLQNNYGNLEMQDQRKYGDSLISFFGVSDG